MAKGEEPPKMGDVGPVEGVAKKQCNMTIPYAVEGEKQSEVKILVRKVILVIFTYHAHG